MESDLPVFKQSSIHLGTFRSREEVLGIVYSLGFKPETRMVGSLERTVPRHGRLSDICLQIHDAAYFPDNLAIKTEIEFSDQSKRFPENPEAMELLGEISGNMPELLYREPYLGTQPTPAHRLSDILEAYSGNGQPSRH
jgi:hypothetical protein